MSATVPALIPRASAAALELTDNVALESILEDIPFFCVGLVAFAFFAFMLIMNRVNLLSSYLYTAALFSFGAAVLDLAQILARGVNNVELNTGITSGISAIIDIREVGLSVAVGLRFLFFWTFVAERPRGEPPPTTNLNDPQNYVYYAKNSHSARWERWGYIGSVLKWLILTAILSIPILQIIWRIAVRHFGTVYMTEATIEILVSALLILKVFLNVFLSPDTPWWKPFRYYGAPLVTLLINVALGIGQLASFLFSEGALGRFLQALEIYILIIFLLIVSFYKIPTRPKRPRISIDMPYMGDEKSGNFVFVTASPTEARMSKASRVSSWILAPRLQTEAGVLGASDQLKMEEDVELGLGSSEPQTSQPVQPITVDSSRVTEELGQQSVQAPPSPKPDVSVQTPRKSRTSLALLPENTSSMEIPDKMEGLAAEIVSRPSTGVSLFYYGVDRDSVDRGSHLSRMSIPNPPFMKNEGGSSQSSRTESPVYGLGGIVNQRRVSTGSLIRSPRGSSVSSFDELIKQQAELDKSIAALRLFSAPASFEDIQTEISPVTATTTSGDVLRSTSTVTTSSARSEFSLSIFPDPPELGPPELMPPRISYATLRGKRLSRRDVPSSFDNGSSYVPSLPVTPTRLVPGRFVSSNATQYDVTSFIGDLTNPSSGSFTKPPRAMSSLQADLPPPSPSGAGPVDVKIESTSNGPKKLLSPTIPTVLELSTPEVVTPPVELIPSQDNDTPLASPPSDPPSYPQLRPFFLGSVTSPTISSPLAGGARLPSVPPVGPRKPARGRLALPSNPRPVISGPRRSSLDRAQGPGAFESPRPPPSFSQFDV